MSMSATDYELIAGVLHAEARNHGTSEEHARITEALCQALQAAHRSNYAFKPDTFRERSGIGLVLCAYCREEISQTPKQRDLGIWELVVRGRAVVAKLRHCPDSPDHLHSDVQVLLPADSDALFTGAL